MRFWVQLRIQNLYCITFNIGGNYARRRKQKRPMVDIDTSGPGADVELEEQKPEGEVEY